MGSQPRPHPVDRATGEAQPALGGHDGERRHGRDFRPIRSTQGLYSADVDPLIVLLGLGVGVLVGLTGVGGGALMTPLLILVFGIKPVTAVGTDLAYGAITKTVGGWRHVKLKTVDFGISTWMAFGSVPAAVGGAYLVHVLEDSLGSKFDDVVIIAVGCAILLTGSLMFVKTLLTGTPEEGRQNVEPTRRNKVGAAVFGAVVGFILGVTSAGSGSLIAVGLILVFKLAPHRVVGTDVFHAAILLWAAAIAHIVAGNVDFALAGTILLGSVPGVVVGSWLSVRTPVEVLRTVLGIVLIGGGLGLLSKAGAGIPPVAIAACPLVAGALVWRGIVLRNRRMRLGPAAAPH